ncbi:hypothetical protein SARC_05952 [Sphaeroforma arctica JP610]|uniref:Uncharacterized protein n=1 Tax=Sphaeroforma arctica JP610 TaxID=667725 RepID=A0A0L0FY42_9EUKA|nr:hypothetical protein SARC_05952 [Sphaeroforma arctica JP610]KNC81750.1 hypothetical protein SARC_05952 [Sphaeroforma arctica JP610]|eukprot:XP_014155652.1 hypothetical protein SARC_05952 [Sphaeroforma arctica JP610]
MKDWLRREIEAKDESPHAWLHLVYDMVRVYWVTADNHQSNGRPETLIRTIKYWLRREIEANDESPHAWLHLGSRYGADVQYHQDLGGRGGTLMYRLVRSYRTGCCPCWSQSKAQAMVRDAVAAVRDRRARLEQQTSRREDVPLLAVCSRVWYRLRGKSHDLSSRWGGPARVVAVQAPFTHTVEMPDGSRRTFLREELKPHVEKLSEQEERRSVKTRVWSGELCSAWGRWEFWCDEANLPVYAPLVDGEDGKKVLGEDYQVLLMRVLPLKKSRDVFKRKILNGFAFAQSAFYKKQHLHLG